MQSPSKNGNFRLKSQLCNAEMVLVYSISCLRMTWRHKEPGHRQLRRLTNSPGMFRLILHTVRLADGDTPYEGRVEVLHEGHWGTICDDGWNEHAAEVICRSLGYGAGEALWEAEFGEGSGPIWLDDVGCGGYEESIEECGHNGWSVNDCGHHEDAGVRCGKCCDAYVCALQWRHTEPDDVSNHRRLDSLLNCLLWRRSKKASKLRVTGLCEGNSPVTGNSPHK